MGRPRKEWTLDPADVVQTAMASSSGRRDKATTSGRKTSETGLVMELTHRPTGEKVSGGVPGGHYSKSEMLVLRQRLHSELFSELEKKVARHLRLPGR
jgi:hypothetical protein